MLHNVVLAEYQGEYKIKITFDNDSVGVVDFSSYLDKGGVFEHFKNIEFFKAFKVNHELGVITWNDEIDIAPETLYSLVTNSPLPDWMN